MQNNLKWHKVYMFVFFLYYLNTQHNIKINIHMYTGTKYPTQIVEWFDVL